METSGVDPETQLVVVSSKFEAQRWIAARDEHRPACHIQPGATHKIPQQINNDGGYDQGEDQYLHHTDKDEFGIHF